MNEFNYRAGIIGRGRFVRIARADGWDAKRIREFAWKHKKEHKRNRRRQK